MRYTAVTVKQGYAGECLTCSYRWIRSGCYVAKGRKEHVVLNRQPWLIHSKCKPELLYQLLLHQPWSTSDTEHRWHSFTLAYSLTIFFPRPIELKVLFDRLACNYEKLIRLINDAVYMKIDENRSKVNVRTRIRSSVYMVTSFHGNNWTGLKMWNIDTFIAGCPGGSLRKLLTTLVNGEAILVIENDHNSNQLPQQRVQVTDSPQGGVGCSVYQHVIGIEFEAQVPAQITGRNYSVLLFVCDYFSSLGMAVSYQRYPVGDWGFCSLERGHSWPKDHSEGEPRNAQSFLPDCWNLVGNLIIRCWDQSHEFRCRQYISY